jgi:hypothetical protein
MLSLQDCLDLTEISDGELAAIARHEKIPPIVALELGHLLIQTAAGVETLRQFIHDDILSAQRQIRCRDCEQFSRTLADYNEKHPKGPSAPPDQVERLHELLAIGQREELGKLPKDSVKRRKIALRDVQKAKDRHDCCACGRLSLRLLRLLEIAGDDAAARKP